jgi:prepilin-type N-terminal cleavage/methylation domain-containing protein
MHTHIRRAGFTLVELIVAMTIILILATLAVALLPRLGHQERSARGADLLQRWLLIAKMRAQADRTPSGLRFIVDPSDPNVVREIHYIQVPEPYSKGLFLNGGQGRSTFQGADFDGGAGLTSPDQAPVQPGDYLEVYGGGPVTQITAVTGPNSTGLYSLAHTGTTPSSGSPTSNYRIIRQPRRIQGEAPLLMPQDIGIDLSRSLNLPVRMVGTTPFREVLFAPGGGVIGRGTTDSKIIFWVRDMTLDSPTAGGPTLIVVHTRTGLIAAHPVDIAGSDPYSFTRDPRSSGL